MSSTRLAQNCNHSPSSYIRWESHAMSIRRRTCSKQALWKVSKGGKRTRLYDPGMWIYQGRPAGGREDINITAGFFLSGLVDKYPFLPRRIIVRHRYTQGIYLIASIQPLGTKWPRMRGGEIPFLQNLMIAVARTGTLKEEAGGDGGVFKDEWVT